MVEEHMSSAKLAKKEENRIASTCKTKKYRRWKKKEKRKTVSRWVIEKETSTHHVAAAAAAAVTPIRHQIVKSSLQITSRSSKYETHFSFSSYSYSSFSCCYRRCCKTRNPGAELVPFLEFQNPSSSSSTRPTRSFPRNSRPKLDECCCFRAPSAHPLPSHDPRNFHRTGSSYAPTLIAKMFLSTTSTR